MGELLHVEDEDVSAAIFRAAFEEAGIEVTISRVADGEQALRYLRGAGLYVTVKRPDIIFLDLNLPRVDGWQVLLERKEEESLRSIPVVVLSTLYGRANRDRAYALGAKYYITKPATFHALVVEVKSAYHRFAA